MMSKKTLEIVSAIGSVLILIVLLIVVNATGMSAVNYGFVASILAFVIIVSAIGIGLANME